MSGHGEPSFPELGYIAELRERLDRAAQRGQVELHVDLGTMELLVSIAELVRDSARPRGGAS